MSKRKGSRIDSEPATIRCNDNDKCHFCWRKNTDVCQGCMSKNNDECPITVWQGCNHAFHSHCSITLQTIWKKSTLFPTLNP